MHDDARAPGSRARVQRSRESAGQTLSYTPERPPRRGGRSPRRWSRARHRGVCPTLHGSHRAADLRRLRDDGIRPPVRASRRRARPARPADGASTPLAWVGRAAGVSLLVVLHPSAPCSPRLGLARRSPSILVVTRRADRALGLVLRSAAAWRPTLAIGAAGLVGRGRRRRRPRARRSSSSRRSLPSARTSCRAARRPGTTYTSPRSTADARRLPGRSSPEWGALRPFPTDYLPVTAHTAAALLLAARRPAGPPRGLPARSSSALGAPLRDAPVPPLGLRLGRAGRRDPAARDRPARPEVRWLSARDGRARRSRCSRCGSPTGRSSSASAASVARGRVVGAALVFLSHAEVFLVLAAGARRARRSARLLVARGGSAGRARPSAAGSRRALVGPGTRDRDRRRRVVLGAARRLGADR